jgi:hypothetical protein
MTEKNFSSVEECAFARVMEFAAIESIVLKTGLGNGSARSLTRRLRTRRLQAEGGRPSIGAGILRAQPIYLLSRQIMYVDGGCTAG